MSANHDDRVGGPNTSRSINGEHLSDAELLADRVASKVVSVPNILYAVGVANIGCLLFGYEVGAASWTLLYIKSSAESSAGFYYSYVENNYGLLGLVAAGASLGAVITYPFLLLLGNTIAKKDELLISSFLYFSGSLLQSTSGQLDWDKWGGLCLLIIGRFLYGGGIASTLHAVPQYIAEVMPDDVRGMWGASSEAMVVGGMLLGFGVGYAFELNDDSWVWTFRIAYLLALAMGAMSLYLPNSPSWMISQEYEMSEVLEAVRFIHPHASLHSVGQLVDQINEQKRETEQQNNMASQSRMEYESESCLHRFGLLYELMTPPMRAILVNNTLFRAVIVKIWINMLKVLTGQTIILYYGSGIFSDIYPDKVEECVIVFISVRLFVAVLMTCIADSFGRREFMFYSTVIMFCGMFIAFFGFRFDWNVVAIFGLFTSGVGFQFGLGSVSYFLLNEITPYYIRASSNALSNWILFLVYFITTFVFPYIVDGIGYDYVFLIFSFLNLYACGFIYYYLPETRGVGIEVAYKLVDEKFNRAPTFDFSRCVCKGGKDSSGKRPNLCCWEGLEQHTTERVDITSRVSNTGETLSYYNPISDAVVEESSSLLRYTD